MIIWQTTTDYATQKKSWASHRTRSPVSISATPCQSRP
nr:MAG TPA: hypothetical protein [Caudoviricetes sp.]